MPGHPLARRIDVRVVLGAALVAASVAGTVLVSGVLDRGVLVYAAAETLAVGERLDPDDLVLTRVGLGTSQGAYLRAERLPEQATVLRAVERGELLPASAVGAAGEDLSTVVITVDGTLPHAVGAGRSVDVWTAAPDADSGFAPPRVLVEGVVVVRVLEPGAFEARAGSVELLVPRGEVAAVLDATVNDHAVSLVPAGAEALG